MNDETPLQAAQRFAANPIRKGFKFEALHCYHNANGDTLFYRIRLKNPVTGEKWIRPMHCDEQACFVPREPIFSTGKPLYNLHNIFSSNNTEIWVTEGELCVDMLNKLGLLATTSGSSDSVATADWTPLKNKKIIIWPDNDESGYKYAKAVTKKLIELGCDIRWIDVQQLHLNQKEDCVDWLEKNSQATLSTLLALPTIKSIQPNILPEAQDNICFTVEEKGVYYHEHDKRIWLCSKLEVLALACDHFSKNWSRLLVLKDVSDNLHQWVMPMNLLKGSGEELFGELLNLRLVIAPGTKKRRLLTEYITSRQPKMHAWCVYRTGWHDSVFVLPHKTIGATSEKIIYQSEYHVKHYLSSSSLAEWQKEVSHYAQGNSRLLLAISAAFASLLLHLVGAESGGLHFVGESSCGKTTALRVAASVFGAPAYLNRWRATANGIEALAMMHNDTLLVLDELAQIDPREAGEIAYMLANGTGKTRANKNGMAKLRYEWRLLFLSAGEVGLGKWLAWIEEHKKLFVVDCESCG
jgi:hypothetical protein